MVVAIIMIPGFLSGQNQKTIVKKYLTELPSSAVKNNLQKYRMTAVYTNRDLYGNFTGKTKISGDYTWGLENGQVRWNNVRIAGSNSFSEPFPEGNKAGIYGKHDICTFIGHA